MRHDKSRKSSLLVDNLLRISIGFDFIEIDVKFDHRYMYDLK